MNYWRLYGPRGSLLWGVLLVVAGVILLIGEFFRIRIFWPMVFIVAGTGLLIQGYYFRRGRKEREDAMQDSGEGDSRSGGR